MGDIQRDDNRKVAMVGLWAVLTVFCAVGSALPTADQMLAELQSIPLPDKTTNDRGHMVEALVAYVSEYTTLAARFRQQFPDHPKVPEIVEREISLVSKMQQTLPLPRWEKHLEQLKQWNPERVTKNIAFRAMELQRLIREFQQAQDKSPEEIRKARQKAFDWTAANADFEEARDYAFHLATELGTDVSKAEQNQWLDKFRRAFPDDPRSKVTPDLEPPVEVGQALALVFEDIHGEKIATERLKGKVIVVDFWATWCGPCLVAGKVMKEVYEAYSEAGRLEIIGVNMDQEKKDCDKFLADSPYPWPIVWDAKGRYSKRWQFSAIPHFLIIDQKGILRFRGNSGQIRNEVLKYLDPQALQAAAAALGLSEEDLKPLTSPDASADEMFEALETAKEPDWDVIAAKVGDEAARELFPLHRAAHAAKLCDMAWKFLHRHGDDLRCGRVLEIWAGWINDERMAANPHIVAQVMRSRDADFGQQIASLRQRHGRDHARLIDLAVLIHDARTAKSEGRSSEVYAQIKKRLIDFCEAKPDDRLNVPAFFNVMSAMKSECSDDPAKECPVPLRLVATDLQGRAIDSAAWKGNVVFVYFSYYPQSHLSMLRELWRKYHGRGLEIVEINVFDDRSRIEAYVKTGKAPFEGSKIEKEESIPWPVVMGPENPRHWCLGWLYSNYASLCILDQQGRICYTHSGWANDGIDLGEGYYRFAHSDVPEVIASLLDDSPSAGH